MVSRVSNSDFTEKSRLACAFGTRQGMGAFAQRVSDRRKPLGGLGAFVLFGSRGHTIVLGVAVPTCAVAARACHLLLVALSWECR
mmetsp:Transcript_8791/g.19522  ORF Transcript_8791/g.19522 Transcript_8791/m.19522 type:complete len:85 (-) Transcript_8791:45-299(-)